MNKLTQDLLAKYKVKREALTIPPDVGQSTEAACNSYRKAAAVLQGFRPDVLRPLDLAYADEPARQLLADDLLLVPGGLAEGMFALKLTVRKKALRQLGTREAMRAALEANPERVQTPLQTMWETYLNSGLLPDPNTLHYQQLTQYTQLIEWLDGLDPALPTTKQVQRLLREKSIVATFDHLVVDNFTGRQRELNTISSYIRESNTSNGILGIYGPGGVGKSALIGRVLWEYSQQNPDERIPFAYLAFDQPTLRIDQPYTILTEAVNQFALQALGKQTAIALYNDVLKRYRELRSDLGKRSGPQQVRGMGAEITQQTENLLYRVFSIFVNLPVGNQSQPATLLVLDTFEEVQYHDRETLTEFWRMLVYLLKHSPALRIVICGRAPIEEVGSERVPIDNLRLINLPLLNLDLHDRVLLLLRLGVVDKQVATTVAQQVGGNPLTLQLAANVITKAPHELTQTGIGGIGSQLRFQIDEQLIQGQLYRRILDHIHDPNVRKLAHPGMVLRRVTPDVILNVLAPTCHLAISGIGEAQLLFEALRREHGLVQASNPGTLVYRPEIRQAMVRLLRQDRPADISELHQKAVWYYQDRPDPQDRAEELYHRLMLNQEPWELEPRWLKDIEGSIAANLDDYSDEMKVWLASRMSLELPRSVFANADAVLWERNVTRKVQQALSRRNYQEAYNLLTERPDRSPDSPLFALEAKLCLVRRGKKDPEQAWKVLEAGVVCVAEGGNRGRMAELHWLQSQAAILMIRELDEADSYLTKAQQAIEKASTQLPLMHILGQRLLLQTTYPKAFALKSISSLRVQLGEVCLAFDEPFPTKSHFVAHLASLMLDGEFPKAEANLARFVPGNPTTDWPGAVSSMTLTEANLQGLDPFLQPWELDNESSIDESILL
ncbi:ATP-binding protein [Spirosoma sp.]|uniref:ATP-binding protein n=1 Tax=Spirosoma sp. TaxID=1899569 RepID=UPI0026027CD7|nr:ATP-binding protein [Spirosoma sp.]MCX6213822.1 ATP-binding protein [Spirosoma sp.]